MGLVLREISTKLPGFMNQFLGVPAQIFQLNTKIIVSICFYMGSYRYILIQRYIMYINKRVRTCLYIYIYTIHLMGTNNLDWPRIVIGFMDSKRGV